MILQLISSSILRRTPPGRRCRFGRVRSLANTWRTSRSVSEGASSPFVWTLTFVENGGTTLNSAKYHLLPIDLRTPPSESIAPLLTSKSPSSPSQEGPILSPDLPTLLLFECVLVYVTPEASQTLIQWFTDYFVSSSILGAVVYEMFGLNDSFGNVMVENLKVPFTPSLVPLVLTLCYPRSGASLCRGPCLTRHLNLSLNGSRGTNSLPRKLSHYAKSERP